MKFFVVSIFPEIFDSFINNSLIKKAIDTQKIEIFFVNPRDFCLDKHRQVDDEIYGWWKWMLLKAQPVIQSVQKIISQIDENFKIVYVSPSKKIFNQKIAQDFSNIQNIIFVCWRYEWIDFRFEQYFVDKYKSKFEKISLWKFIIMWGEVAAMTMIESISRLVPWVIKEEESHKIESYDTSKDMQNIEFPQYTRPEEVYDYKVPQVLLSGNHKEIQKRRDNNEEK